MKSIKSLTLAGVIAALYVALTWVTLPIAYSPIQLRISEALTVLPFFFPPAAAALTVGCFFANLLSGYGAVDLIVGPIATLLGGILTAAFGAGYRKRYQRGIMKISCFEYFLAAFPPVLFNSRHCLLGSGRGQIFRRIYGGVFAVFLLRGFVLLRFGHGFMHNA